ncbi:MAG TPA: polysaccharide deacetylase family protein [Candidatus Limnocylindria bacterium]|nr:polysaccharide deacetylase family protein [Candidatus Limnocylindria bacterium]
MSLLPSRLFVLVAVVALLLSACGSQPSALPTPSAPVSASASPSAPASPDETGEPSASSLPSPSAPAGTTYTVQAGDTLFSIARAWGTTVAQLQAWNSGMYPSLATDPSAIQAGWVLVVSGDPSATPVPTAQPTAPPPSSSPPPPVASGCRAGNRVAAGSPQTFYTVPNAGQAVALTFDMGGRLEPGVDILNLLVERKVCATLFPTGAMTDSPQGRQVMAIVRAHPELFEIGNHTMHHCDLVRGGGGSPSAEPCKGVTPTASFIKRELTDAAAILERESGQRPVPYWRPPYGSLNDAVIAAAASAGYTKTFMWDIDTIDWKPIDQGGPTAEQIATKVITQARGGSNVLMHLGGYETLEALKIMIPGLRQRGFLLTSLSDLLQ